ncbi:hypothetical protein N9917_01050 [Deltaproteobacteria bacterium]|nr:hypothetical protein [Deltaproteobacteria bacterium]
MARRNQRAQDHSTILANLPAGTTRVQVIDDNGQQQYKKPAEVLLTDNICFGKDGEPITMSGKPGRPATVKLLPASDQIAEQVKQKKKVMKNDHLVKTVTTTPDSDDVLNHIITELSHEAASMKFERQEAERKGLETSRLSVRRVDALKKTADVWLKRREQLSEKGMDLEGPAFKAVFAFMMETLRETLVESGMRPEMVETVFTGLGNKLDESWKAEAKARMKGV